MIFDKILLALFATAQPEAIPATFVRIIDGDTFEVMASLPFNVYVKVKIRLFGVNTPEMKGLQKRAGIGAADFTKTWAATYPDVVLVLKGKSFDRYVATVCPPSGSLCLGEALIRSGHGVAYDHKEEQRKKRARSRRKAKNK